MYKIFTALFILANAFFLFNLFYGDEVFTPELSSVFSNALFFGYPLLYLVAVLYILIDSFFSIKGSLKEISLFKCVAQKLRFSPPYLNILQSFLAFSLLCVSLAIGAVFFLKLFWSTFGKELLTNDSADTEVSISKLEEQLHDVNVVLQAQQQGIFLLDNEPKYVYENNAYRHELQLQAYSSPLRSPYLGIAYQYSFTDKNKEQTSFTSGISQNKTVAGFYTFYFSLGDKLTDFSVESGLLDNLMGKPIQVVTVSLDDRQDKRVFFPTYVLAGEVEYEDLLNKLGYPAHSIADYSFDLARSQLELAIYYYEGELTNIVLQFLVSDTGEVNILVLPPEPEIIN